MTIIWGLVPILAILVAFLIICRVGTTLLVLTGLDQPTAQFQALSALTGTGFTTRASEMIVGHEVRRRIVMVLMVIGNLGLAGGVASLIGAFRTQEIQMNLLRVVTLIGTVTIIFWLAGGKKLWRKINERLQLFLEERPIFKRSTVEELLSFHGQYSIVEIQVQQGDHNVGKALRNTDFRQRRILVLAIEREHKLIALPGPDEVIQAGDKLTCYGNLDSIADSIIYL